MKISVIIVTYNRIEDLRHCLNEYARQTFTNYEIIVVDNNSVDGTRNIIPAEFPNVKYIYLPDNFDIKAFNIALETSDGDIVWRCDDDSFPVDDNCFQRIIDIFTNHDDVDIIATEIVSENNNIIFHWYPLEVNKLHVPETGYKSNTFMGPGAAIRRKVFTAVGGLWGFGFEELEFSTRAILAGYNVRYYPDLLTCHIVSLQGKTKANTFIMCSKQYMRYNWKYYPFFRAFFRSIVIIAFQHIVGIMQHKSLNVLLEAHFGMLESALAARRKEYIKVSNENLNKISLGFSIFHDYWCFIKHTINVKLQKHKNKLSKNKSNLI